MTPARQDKPIGRGLGWRVVETRYPFATPWIQLRQDEVAIQGRPPITYTYLHQAPAVYVVPVTTAGQVVLIRQYRYPVDAWCLEVPAGGSGDRLGMPLREVARRELREEIGATCGPIEPVALFYGANAHSDQESHVFLALKVELGAKQTLEATEQIEIRPVSTREALAMARTGQISDGSSALALLLCEDLLHRYGYLDRRE